MSRLAAKGSLPSVGRQGLITDRRGRPVHSSVAARKTSGELVVLAREEYEDLVRASEDMADAGVVRAAETNPGARDYLPAEAVNRLLAGDSPMRVWRKHRGLTARALAERSKVDPAYLSQIETGKKPGSLRALRAIADALDVKLDDLA